jgi:hypothetical protein
LFCLFVVVVDEGAGRANDFRVLRVFELRSRLLEGEEEEKREESEEEEEEEEEQD